MGCVLFFSFVFVGVVRRIVSSERCRDRLHRAEGESKKIGGAPRGVKEERVKRRGKLSLVGFLSVDEQAGRVGRIEESEGRGAPLRSD